MRSWVDKTPQDLPYTLTGKADRGGGLYKTHCSSCHGAEGKGGRGTGITQSRTRSYKFMAPALNNTGFLASVSNQMMFNTISNGRIDYGMPAFDILSETDKADLIAYIRQWSTLDKAKAKPVKENKILSIATIVESPYSFEKTIENVKESIHGKNYQIFPDRFIEQGLLNKEEVNQRQVAIRVCNFKRLYQLLNVEPRLGVILPCRITVIEDEDGKVKIIAPNINLASKVFNNDQLGRIFKELNDDLEEIIEEATL
jgi:cytochrome c oxidase cbb3-type subunit 3